MSLLPLLPPGRSVRKGIHPLRRRELAAWGLLVACVLPSSDAVAAAESSAGYRRSPLTATSPHEPGFTLLPGSDLGIQFTNVISPNRVQQNQNAMNGSGVAAGDVDGDGWCDLFFCNKEGPCALYRSLGNGRFADITQSSNTACTNQLSAGAVFGDIDGDGDLDLIVSSFGGPNACLVNDGRGHFTDVTQAAGLVGRTGSTSIALADLDGDGDLDLYLCNFGVTSILRDGGQISTRMLNGKPVVTGRFASRLKIVDGILTEYGEPDVLYWNDGKGHFTPADWPATFTGEDGQPATSMPDFGLAVQIRDINGDGLPDIYVCNDFQTPDRIWINAGGGKFKALETLALRNMSFASMGVDFADLDRDGHLDFITVEMLSRDHRHHVQQSSPMRPVPRQPGHHLEREQMPRNTLYHSRGDGTYEEIAYSAGVAATDWSWAPVFLDVDLDGYEDLIVSNGHMHDVNSRDVNERASVDRANAAPEARNRATEYPPLNSPKYAFRNRGDLTFEEVGLRWGIASTAIAHGACLLDIDHDGDLDLVMNAVNHDPLIYRNNAASPRVAVRLRGRGGNPHGIGGTIIVRGGAVAMQSQEIVCGGRYLSGDDTLRTFAAGSSTNVLSIEVRWRSGGRSIIKGVQPGYLYEIEEAASDSVPPPSSRSISSPPLLGEASERLNWTHVQTLLDDFSIQALLPKKLSQLGPGVAVCDLNADGFDDIVIGNGAGAAPGILLGNGRGGFTSMASDLPASADDLLGVAAFQEADRGATILFALANYRSRDRQRGAVESIGVHGGVVSRHPPLPPLPGGASPGCVAVADLDGDGDLDLFVGARFQPGRYPEAADSAVFRREAQGWSLDPIATQAVKSAGLVVAAVWTDLNGDGFPELVLSCDWGPVRVFANEKGRLRESTHELGLDGSTGWWTGVSAGDWDGDGRIDLIAGNWGLNGPEQIWSGLPYHVFYGELAEDPTVQVIEAIEDPTLKKLVPYRDFALLRGVMPALRTRVETHAQFASLSVSELLGSEFPRLKHLNVTTLTSCVFLNRGDHFESVALPAEAQRAPVYGMAVADLDGDGHEDVFLSQNCFAVRPDATRLDAGRGLWLRGDGKGRFAAVPGATSGVRLYGEQRGCAIGDFDLDGRPDLVVAENGGPLHLFLNQGGRPGLRIRLRGPAENPAAIGAQVQLRFATGWGPVREVHAGAGYGSQDSPTLVLATPSAPLEARVRFAGGKVLTVPVPVGAREVQVVVPNP